jgi:hypothetical protein
LPQDYRPGAFGQRYGGACRADTYDIARFYESRVLPLRQVVSRELALRYSTAVNIEESMRVDLFKVLADARARIAANAAAVDARRDFGLSEVDLQAALTFGSGDPRAMATNAGGPSGGSSSAMGN